MTARPPAGRADPEIVGPLGAEYAEAVSALVRRVFLRFEAPDYPQEGTDTFFVFTDPGFLSFNMSAGLLVVAGCFEDGRLLGVVALRDRSHVSLLFVEPTRHRRGIGTALMRWAQRRAAETGAEPCVMTVNSSPYARGFYEKIGFHATAEEQMRDGIRYIPMSLEPDV
ncbi:MAG: GNAT family N-acetyltransferase [Clostridia bacterium]|nr:GNAT family N-acetyltransferase [Clostridia bacterium]